MTIHEQVELVIQQATNPDLLCQMYEGWTSWI
jgi:phosphatidylinositol kinase/protein kinase (PI-3  family)